MRTLTSWGAVAIGALALLVPSLAAADNKANADALFKKGKRLLDAKKFADACAAFEDSNKLDPGIGAELNLAHCYEEWGKLATAYRRYTDAATMAKREHDNRLDRITDRIKNLEDQVPRIVVRVPDGMSTTGLVVQIDGVGLPLDQLGQPQLADPGPHTIDYRIADTAKREMIVPVEPGETRETKLPLVALEAREHIHPTSPQPPPDPSIGHGQRVGGIVIGGVGIAAIGVSTVVALKERSKYHTALTDDCGGMTNACDPAGLTATHDARSEANIATVVFGVGAAAVVGGVIMYLLAPSGPRAEQRERDDAAFYVAPTVSDTGVGFVLGGRL